MLHSVASFFYKLSPLNSFSKTWMKKVKNYDEKIHLTADELKNVEIKKDYDMYKKQVELLLKKGNLILEGIQSGSKTKAFANAKVIDQLAIEENEFKIVGPITRGFTDLYLKLLNEFITLNYTDIEHDMVNSYAHSMQFQTIEARVQDARDKIVNFTIQKDAYDKEHLVVTRRLT